jgi:hypothetical protein
MKMKTSRRGSSKVRKAQKTKFATYVGLPKQRINTRWLAGQTDESSELVCCWSGGIR